MSNKKVTTKAKEPIKLRTKKLANGNQSLYLDFYKEGQRQYEFLKLYLVPEKTPLDKTANTQTLGLANAVKAQKIVELQNSAHGFSVKNGRSKMNVLDYITDIADKKRIKAGGGKRTTAMVYLALAKQIEAYSGLKTTFKQIDKKYCEGFIEYLKTAKNKNTRLVLSENTAFGYMKKFESILNTAISDEVTNINPFKQIKPENKPKKRKTEIVYLTIDDVQKLENTESLLPYVDRYVC